MAENKKDSFTFSDKIKNSKPAVNPFAKKGASKIGNNGKPKQTLFERTRRDAPFMVAAAAALLMLPFLYKYSGTVNDDVIVPPGSEDSVFDPERFGFSPSAEDPNGQIAQLAGRDPLSLIKGWGDPEKADEEPSYDRDGLDDTNDWTPPSSRRPDASPLRSSIPPQTRASFQRRSNPTKINDLRGASLNLRGGGGIGSRFGGAQLKAAAKQSSASKPKQGAKPVSLTPLRAANNPSRSYFGQGGAAQARASRDALSKANATEALRDAMFAPVENHRLGGLDDGVFAAGGGPGKFDRNMNFKGIEPWWWDMMKQQEMEKWKWNYFLWRKGLVEPLIKALAAMLAKIGTNLGCCLIMGDSDCDPDFFAGNRSGGGGKEAKCGDMNLKYFLINYQKEYDAAGGDFETACKALKKNAGENDKARFEWQGEKSGSGQKTGFFSQRWACLGGKIHGNEDYELADRFSCRAVDVSHNFELQGSGPVRRWKKYHAIVARNAFPVFNENGEFDHYIKGGLCAESNLRRKGSTAGGVAQHNNDGSPIITSEQAAAQNWKHTEHSAVTTTVTGTDPLNDANFTLDERQKGLLEDNLNDDCVLYIARNDRLDWNNFRSMMINMMQRLTPKNGEKIVKVTPEIAEKMFNALQIHFVEGYAFGGALAGSRRLSSGLSDKVAVDKDGDGVYESEARIANIPAKVLPVSYVDFEYEYLLTRNTGSKTTSKIGSYKRCYAQTYYGVDGKTRTVMVDDCKTNAVRTACLFANFRITANTIMDPGTEITSVLTYNENIHDIDGGKIHVTVEIRDGDQVIWRGEGEKVSYRNGTANFRVGDAGSEVVRQFLAQSTTTSSTTTQDGEETTTTTTEKHNSYVAYWTATYLDETSADDADYSNDSRAAETTQITPNPIIPPPTQYTNKTRLARSMADIPSTFNARNTFANATEWANNPVSSSGSHQFTFKKDSVNDDLAQLNKAYASSDAVIDYISEVVTLYNSKVAQGAPTMFDGIEGLSNHYPTIPEMLDAMYIAQVNGKTDIPMNVVCDMARGIALKSHDITATDEPNTFGTFAIYMGQGFLYPADKIEDAQGNPRAIKRFDCIKNGKYTCTPDYQWSNYIKNRAMAPYPNYNDGLNRDYPLSAFLTGNHQVVKPSGTGDAAAKTWRKNYLKATKEIFGSASGACEAFGTDTMPVADAIRYVEKVIEKGLSHKPATGSGRTAGERVGNTNVGHSAGGAGGTSQGGQSGRTQPTITSQGG